MKKKYSRREALIGAVGGVCALGPLQVLVANMLGGMVNKAYAEASGITPRNYVYIYLGGGPQRWVWDPLLAFDDPSKIVTNPGLITKFIADGAGNYTSGEYATTLQKGANMPWLWQYDIPTSAGPTVPMNSLMDSMLVMLGIDVNNPAHTGATHEAYFPLGIPNSLTSLSADVSSAPIPHISINGRASMFKSKKGKTGIYTSARRSALEDLLSPFTLSQSSSFQLEKNKIDAELRKVASNFSKYARKAHPGAVSLLPNKSNAEELMIKSFGNLTTVYLTLYNKYRDLINIITDPFVQNLAGISDRQVGPDSVLLDSVKVGTLNGIAGRFAMTEFLILNKLTQSITFNATNFSQSDPNLVRFNHDSHSEDALVNTLSTTFFNLAMGACLNELKSQFTTAGVYDDTLIHISGEFNRNPRADGSGNDHGYKNGSSTFFSGAIKKFQVIGNTSINSGSNSHPGTYGVKASNPVYGELNLGHVAASVATMLKTASPVTSNPSLVEEKNGEITSLLGLPKLVA